MSILHVTGRHGVVFQPPLTRRQWDESRFTVWCDAAELRRWIDKVRKEEHEKRYGKPKPKPESASRSIV